MIKKTPDKFAELAKEYSDDGSAESGGVIDVIFTRNSLALYPEYVAGAYALEKVGDYSLVPVESSAGYHIIRIDAEMKDIETLTTVLKDEVTDEECTAFYSEVMEEKFSNADIHLKKKFKYWTEGNETYK